MISRLVIATRNQGKLTEIQKVLTGLAIDVLSLNDFPQINEIAETGASFAENAHIKAEAVFKATGLPALADDSGLEVDSLNGAPGVFSARYSGKRATDARNNQKLLTELISVPSEQRTARFRCVMVLKTVEKNYTVDGKCEGIILTELKGSEGFGYDPLFYVPSHGKTFAELDLDEKNQISHRGIALRKIRTIIENDKKIT